MKKLFYGLFIGAFLLLSLTLSLGMVFGVAQPTANEILVEAPSLTAEDGSFNAELLSDTAAWVNDRFFLRNELISLDRRLNASVLGTSSQDSVLLGKDGWLYFRDTLNDYTGASGMTDRQLQHAAHNLALMAQYCEENGKQFLFVIAPNKNALYEENMPSFGVKAAQTDAEKLHSLLEGRVPYADLFKAFGQTDEVLYFAHDSHWNSKGAALGADVINGGFGVESDYYGADFSASQPHEGDLYAMLYPGSSDPETDPVYGGALKFTFTGRASKPDAITLETAGQGTGKLLAYRDSFGNLLYPYLADSFSEATFSRSVSYDLTKEADFVLIELVQRNLRYLITYVPVMPSPAEQLQLPAAAEGALTFESAKKSGLLQVTGTLPEEADSAWVVCDGLAYRAFMLDGCGFAANVPVEANIEKIVYTVSGETLMYELNGGN